MMVSDSGPIIAFSRIGRLDILRRLFGQVIDSLVKTRFEEVPAI